MYNRMSQNKRRRRRTNYQSLFHMYTYLTIGDNISTYESDVLINLQRDNTEIMIARCYTKVGENRLYEGAGHTYYILKASIIILYCLAGKNIV